MPEAWQKCGERGEKQARGYGIRLLLLCVQHKMTPHTSQLQNPQSAPPPTVQHDPLRLAPPPPPNIPPPSPRLMTKRDTFIEKDVMMNIVMNIQVRV